MILLGVCNLFITKSHVIKKFGLLVICGVVELLYDNVVPTPLLALVEKFPTYPTTL